MNSSLKQSNDNMNASQNSQLPKINNTARNASQVNPFIMPMDLDVILNYLDV